MSSAPSMVMAPAESHPDAGPAFTVHMSDASPPELAPLEREALAFISGQIADAGAAPTLKEIQAGLSLNYYLRARKLVASLADKGYIDWEPGRHRAIGLRDARIPRPSPGVAVSKTAEPVATEGLRDAVLRAFASLTCQSAPEDAAGIDADRNRLLDLIGRVDRGDLQPKALVPRSGARGIRPKLAKVLQFIDATASANLPGPSLRQIASHMGYTYQNAAQTIINLKAKGLIVRTPDNKLNLALTAEGREAIR